MNLSDIVHTAAAIRLRQRLLPEGGPGDKVFPPTFAGGVYCWETRRIEGSAVPCVLLDSVASQATPLEEALAEAVDRNLIVCPASSFNSTAGWRTSGRSARSPRPIVYSMRSFEIAPWMANPSSNLPCTSS